MHEQVATSLLVQAPAPPEGMQNNLAALYSQNAAQRPAKKNFRNIPQAPERILDAPELLDDYYLNLLDWGPMNNVVCGWHGIFSIALLPNCCIANSNSTAVMHL